MVLNLLERLESVCDENVWTTSRKVLHKLTSSGVGISDDCVGNQWNELLSAMGKALHKGLKKATGKSGRILFTLS